MPKFYIEVYKIYEIEADNEYDALEIAANTITVEDVLDSIEIVEVE